MYNNFSSKKTKKVISALLASALVVTSAPITADAATTKVLGVKKTFTVAGTKVTGLSKTEKKVVKVTIKNKKVTVKGLKAGKVSFKIGKETYNVNVGATKVTATAAATTLKVNDTTKVSITAKYGAKDKLTIKTSKSSVVKIGKSSVTADKNGKASVTLRGLAAGTSTITVKSANTGMYAKVKITVKADETATAAPTSDAPATLAPATDAPVGPTVVPTSGGAVTTAPTSGGAVTAAPTATPTTPATVATLSAVTASAISTNKIAFTFNRTVTASAINADDVIISDTTERKFVKAVTTSASDKNTVELELFDNLTTGKTYSVTIPVEGSNYVLSVKYTQGEVAKIVVKNQTIPAGTDTKIEYKVLDANGLDITNTVTPQFESDQNASTGSLTLADKQVAFVKVKIALANGAVVSSEQFTVTGAARVAKELTNYTIGSSAPTYTAKDYAQVLTIQKQNVAGYKLYSEIKDQFGSVVSSGTTYESMNTAVAIIDKTTGDIIPMGVGKAAVKISNGDFSKTVQIEVVDNSVIQKLVVDKPNVELYKGLSQSTSTVNVKTVDQYGVKTNVSAVTVKVVSDANGILDKTTIEAQTSLTAGNLTITATTDTSKVAKSGTAVVEVKDNASTKTTNIVVTISELGQTVGYGVDGTKTVLDVNTAKDASANTESITVRPIDKDGKRSGEDVEFKYSVVDDNNATNKLAETAVTGKTLTISVDAGSTLTGNASSVTLKSGTTYTVTLKVGDLEVKTLKIDAQDTRVAPAVTVAKNTLTYNITANADISAALPTALQNSGVIVVGSNGKLTGIKYTTTDSTVLTSDGSATIKAGETNTANIVLNEATVEDANGTPFTVKLSGTIAVSLDNTNVGAFKAGLTFANDPHGANGVKQVATLTITHGADSAGSVTVDGVAIALTIEDDTAAEVAGKVANGINEASTSNFTASANGSVVTLTAKAAAANVSAALTAGSTGVEAADANTTSGEAAVTDVVTLTVGGEVPSTGGKFKVTFDGVTKEITYSTEDTANAIAEKIKTAFTETDNYTAGVASNTVTFTAKSAGAITTIAYIQ